MFGAQALGTRASLGKALAQQLWLTARECPGSSSCSTWAHESLLTGSRAPAQQLWSGGAAPQRHVESSWVRDGSVSLHCKVDSYLLRHQESPGLLALKSLGNGTLSNLDALYRESNSELLNILQTSAFPAVKYV